MTVYRASLKKGEANERSVFLKKYGFDLISNDESFDNLLKLAKIICDVPIAYISILDDEYQYILAQDGIKLETMPVEDSFCQHTLKSDKILVIEDTIKDDQTNNLPLVNQKKPIAFYSGYPLVDNKKNNFGAFCVMDYQSRKLNKKQEEALKVLGDQVMQSFNLRKTLIASLNGTQPYSPSAYQKIEDLEHQLMRANKKLHTQNKEIEKKYSKLKTANLKLEQKSKDIEAIVDMLPACVSFVDLNYCYQINNQVYEDWFGFSKKELKGKHVSFVIGEDTFKEQLPLFKRAFNGEIIQFEITLNVKEEQHLRVSYLPLTDYRGKVSGTFVFAEDLTDIKRYQKELEISNQSLESFAYIASHDIRSPLKTIASFSTLLKKELGERNVHYSEKHLDFMIKSVKQLENLTSDLLNYAIVQNDSVEVNNPCSLKKVFKIVCDNLKTIVSEAGAILNFESTDIKLMVLENDLIQLLQNIISNAIKYQEKENQPLIKISTEIKKNLCNVIIKDNGIGIEEKDIKKISNHLHA